MCILVYYLFMYVWFDVCVSVCASGYIKINTYTHMYGIITVSARFSDRWRTISGSSVDCGSCEVTK